MSDIVERLRSYIVWEPEVGATMEEAANEIARLRITEAEREAIALALPRCSGDGHKTLLELLERTK